MYFFPLKQTNKSSIFLIHNQTFFNCEKSLHANILNALQQRQPHKPKERENRGLCHFQKIKNRWVWLHPFPLFLSLSSFSSPYKRKTLLTYYLTSIYVSFICVTFVTLTNTAFFCFSPFAFTYFFVSLLCVASYLLSERFFVSFSFSINRPTPPPFHGT